MKRCGIEYFPVPVAFPLSFKVLEVKYGCEIYFVYVKLLQSIFGDEGFYVKCDEDFYTIISSEVKLSCDRFKEIVLAFVERGIFDEDMFNKYSILTSEEIQKEYLNAVKRRSSVVMEEKFCLPYAIEFLKDKQKNANIEQKEQNQITQNKAETEKMYTISDKVKESKVKERKENQSKVDESKTSESESTSADTSSSIKDVQPVKHKIEPIDIERFASLTGKATSDAKDIPDNIDIYALIDKIFASKFLKNNAFFTLGQCIKRYDKIMSGAYDDFVKRKKEEESRPQVRERSYTKEELQSFFTNIDDIHFD